jgi:hypothetical protein
MPWGMTTLIQAALAFICRSFLRSPLLVALLFCASLRRVGLRSGRERYVALILPRPGLSEDALSVLQDTPEFSVLRTHTGIMKAIAAGFLPKSIDDNNYSGLSPHEEEAKRRYRAFLQDVLRHVLRLTGIDVIVSGNFAYFAERELHAAAEALGVPFIVLHKENLKSPGRVSYFKNLYRRRRGPFEGRRILVYNTTELDVQTEAGIVPADRINICGMPRLDRSHAWRRAAAGKRLPEQPMILFFTFGAKTGLPALRRKGAGGDYVESLPEFDGLNWEQTAQQTMDAVARFARANPGARVVVKSKLSSAEVEIFRAAAGGQVPANLQLVKGGDPLFLLQEAWAVVGMNTTALLEALAMGKTVLCPHYAEAADPSMRLWIADFGSTVEYAQSPAQLVARLSEIASGPVPLVSAELGPEAVEALERWAGNPDGKASDRVRAFIKSEVEVGMLAKQRATAKLQTAPERVV